MKDGNRAAVPLLNFSKAARMGKLPNVDEAKIMAEAANNLVNMHAELTREIQKMRDDAADL